MVINNIVFNLKKQLATKIKGKIYISYDERNIYVNVEYSAYDLWITSIPRLYAKVSDKKMVNILTQLITAQYKEDILNKYFLK